MSSRWLLAGALLLAGCVQRAPYETIRATSCLESEAEVVRDYLGGELGKAEARARVRLIRRLCDRMHDRIVRATGGEDE